MAQLLDQVNCQFKYDKMKKSITLVVFFALAFISSEMIAQKFSGLDKSPMDVAAYPSSYRNPDKVVKVVYSRPQLKRRKLSKLAPNGKVWRTGANESAEITFYKDVTFGGQPVKAGTYTLFTIPNENEWTIILNKDLNTWGSYFYKESEDAVRVKGEVSTIKKPIEAFSIGFEGEDEKFKMFFGWGKVVVAVPIKG